MSEERTSDSPTLALNTKLEEDFVSPLTAVRGALEILNDHPDLTAAERERFVNVALRECGRLERSVHELADTVYAAGRRALSASADEDEARDESGYAARIRFLPDSEIVDVDLSGLVFSSSRVVNEFFDCLERRVSETGHRWYLLVDYADCSIWPEAWVAFAHRAKKVRVNYAFDTVRYAEEVDGARAHGGDDMLATRELALAHIERLRRARGS